MSTFRGLLILLIPFSAAPCSLFFKCSRTAMCRMCPPAYCSLPSCGAAQEDDSTQGHCRACRVCKCFCVDASVLVMHHIMLISTICPPLRQSPWQRNPSPSNRPSRCDIPMPSSPVNSGKSHHAMISMLPDRRQMATLCGPLWSAACHPATRSYSFRVSIQARCVRSWQRSGFRV